ncbi:serine hydrolase [Moorena sp. SIO3H5]|uniref:serine hydrolase n=1 Tax=Moorena sp. SIO3H5 TaxID=2607834 RepID=UPI0013B62329|nr:serine hydrolase [Moorena sp. SIO3H5]NEO68729.1 serine hydrolase [Moorena sp. SIO3H5]
MEKQKKPTSSRRRPRRHLTKQPQTKEIKPSKSQPKQKTRRQSSSAKSNKSRSTPPPTPRTRARLSRSPKPSTIRSSQSQLRVAYRTPQLPNLRRRLNPFATPASSSLPTITNARNPIRQRPQPQLVADLSPNSSRAHQLKARLPLSNTPNHQSVQIRRTRRERRSENSSTRLWILIIRLLIVGIGLAAIAGTVLSSLGTASQPSTKTTDNAPIEVQQTLSQTISSQLTPLLLNKSPLQKQIQTLVKQHPQLQPGIFIHDLDTGAFLESNSRLIFSAASTIKLPILIAFFQDVDAGKVFLDEYITMKPEMIAGGSGNMKYQKPGKQYKALEVATKMITISDNTATNMLIERLGGIEVLNQRFRSWGLKKTVLRNPLPDLPGTNTTSPRELASLIFNLEQGKWISPQSRTDLIDIMIKTKTNTLLPQGLGNGATIAHKTGTLGRLLADVGLVKMPNGKRYIITVMVKRPFNDSSAEKLIRTISRQVYDYLNN